MRGVNELLYSGVRPRALPYMEGAAVLLHQSLPILTPQILPNPATGLGRSMGTFPFGLSILLVCARSFVTTIAVIRIPLPFGQPDLGHPTRKTVGSEPA